MVIDICHSKIFRCLHGQYLHPSATSNIGTDADRLLDAEKRFKDARYVAVCIAREVTLFTFGMTSMGHLSSSADHFLRWLANRLSQKSTVTVTCSFGIDLAGLWCVL